MAAASTPTARGLQLIELVRTGEVHTLREAGERLGLTRQRVHQLAKRYGVTLPKLPIVPKPRPEVACDRCGSPGRLRLCVRCRASIWVQLVCPRCGYARSVRASSLSFFRTGLCRTCWREISPADKIAYGGRSPGGNHGRKPATPGKYRLAAERVREMRLLIRRVVEEGSTAELPPEPGTETC